MSTRFTMPSNDVHRLTRHDTWRMLHGKLPKSISKRKSLELQEAQMQLILKNFRIMSQLSLVALPVFLLLFCDLTHLFDAVWLGVVCLQMVYCTFLARRIRYRLQQKSLTSRSLLRMLIPAAFVSGLIAGGIPGLVFEEHNILQTGMQYHQTLAMISCIAWIAVGALWIPTFLPTLLALLSGAFLAVFAAFSFHGSPNAVFSTLWLLNFAFILVPGFILLSGGWLRNQLDRIVLEAHNASLARCFADFQDGARDWVIRTDSQLNIVEIPPDRIQNLPQECFPISLDGLFAINAPDNPIFEKSVLLNREIPGVTLRRKQDNKTSGDIWWYLRGTPQFDRDGGFSGYFLIVSDVSAEIEIDRLKCEEPLNSSCEKRIAIGEHGQQNLSKHLEPSSTLRLSQQIQAKAHQSTLNLARDDVRAGATLSASNAKELRLGDEHPPTLWLVDSMRVRQRIASRYLMNAEFKTVCFESLAQVRTALNQGNIAQMVLISDPRELETVSGELQSVIECLERHESKIIWRVSEKHHLANKWRILDPNLDGTTLVRALFQYIQEEREKAA